MKFTNTAERIIRIARIMLTARYTIFIFFRLVSNYFHDDLRSTVLLNTSLPGADVLSAQKYPCLINWKVSPG